MKCRIVLSVLALILFLLATLFSASLVYDVLTLPEDPEEIGESIGAGLTRAIAFVFVLLAAGVQLLSFLLSLIALILARRHAAGRGATVLHAVQTVLPIAVAAVAILLVLP